MVIHYVSVIDYNIKNEAKNRNNKISKEELEKAVGDVLITVLVKKINK